MSLSHLMLILLQNLDMLDWRFYQCYANHQEVHRPYLCKIRALDYFSWENLGKHPFTPDRATVIEQSGSPIQVQLSEPMPTLTFLAVGWARGYCREHATPAPRTTRLCLSTTSFHWITINYKLCQLCWLKFAKESVSFVSRPLASSLFYACLHS